MLNTDRTENPFFETESSIPPTLAWQVFFGKILKYFFMVRFLQIVLIVLYAHGFSNTHDRPPLGQPPASIPVELVINDRNHVDRLRHVTYKLRRIG